MVETMFKQALAHHQSGRIAEAEALYRQVMARQPENPGAVFLLGLCRHQRGDHDTAISLMDAAIAMNPVMPQAHYNRGLALQELGRHGEAVASYAQALALKPDYVQAHNNQGHALARLERLEEALASFDRAIALAPDFAEAHTNRGNALKGLKKLDAALASHDIAIHLRPDYAEAHCNRGNALKALKRLEEAVASYDRAIALRPDYADAYVNRGDTLHELKRHDDALDSYNRAIAVKPDFATAYDMRGNLLMQSKLYVEALADFRRAAELDDGLLSALGQLAHVQMLLCDWSGLERLFERIDAGIDSGKTMAAPFASLSLVASADRQRLLASQYIETYHPESRSPLWLGEHYAHERIRIGYFSSDFRNHAVAYLTARLFECHDRARFEIHAFYFGPDTVDSMHGRLRQAFEHFHDVGDKSDLEIAQLARELEIDIAIDLNGFTMGARTDVFALRPVPIQVSYLGYPGTMGAPYIDYLIADPFLIPPEHQAHYSEKVVYLPHCFQVNDDRKAIADTVFARGALGLPETGFVFCCFNNTYKITPDVFAIWMRLLKQVEGSILWLSEANAVAKENLWREAERRGIARERLIFAQRLPLAEYLSLYRHADLFLDTFCYNAGTTASDALWVGVPVVTKPGNTFARRMAASLVHATGLPELIANTEEAYEARALELARQPARLAEIKRELARKRTSSPLFDTPRFARHLELAFEVMLRQHQAGSAPDHIQVAHISI